jgi:hypothetical protein
METVTQLKTKVSLKEVGPLTEYIGCTVVKEYMHRKLSICQLYLITKLEDAFKNDISKLQMYKTPAAPGEITMKAGSEREMVDAETHKIFRSRVGMLLYFIKIFETRYCK